VKGASRGQPLARPWRAIARRSRRACRSPRQGSARRHRSRRRTWHGQTGGAGSSPMVEGVDAAAPRPSSVVGRAAGRLRRATGKQSGLRDRIAWRLSRKYAEIGLRPQPWYGPAGWRRAGDLLAGGGVGRGSDALRDANAAERVHVVPAHADRVGQGHGHARGDPLRSRAGIGHCFRRRPGGAWQARAARASSLPGARVRTERGPVGGGRAPRARSPMRTLWVARHACFRGQSYEQRVAVSASTSPSGAPPPRPAGGDHSSVGCTPDEEPAGAAARTSRAPLAWPDARGC
jgi:hypothetical protein